MKYIKIKYITWPRDQRREFVSNSTDDFKESDYGILLQLTKTSSIFIPWSGVISIEITDMTK